MIEVAFVRAILVTELLQGFTKELDCELSIYQSREVDMGIVTLGLIDLSMSRDLILEINI